MLDYLNLFYKEPVFVNNFSIYLQLFLIKVNSLEI